jgi:hypothetical protein
MTSGLGTGKSLIFSYSVLYWDVQVHRRPSFVLAALYEQFQKNFFSREKNNNLLYSVGYSCPDDRKRMCGMCGMQLMRDLRSQGLDMHGLECRQYNRLGQVLTIVRWVIFVEGII